MRPEVGEAHCLRFSPAPQGERGAGGRRAAAKSLACWPLLAQASREGSSKTWAPARPFRGVIPQQRAAGRPGLLYCMHVVSVQGPQHADSTLTCTPNRGPRNARNCATGVAGGLSERGRGGNRPLLVFGGTAPPLPSRPLWSPGRRRRTINSPLARTLAP
jgi:hypothetical protein